MHFNAHNYQGQNQKKHDVDTYIAFFGKKHVIAKFPVKQKQYLNTFVVHDLAKASNGIAIAGELTSARQTNNLRISTSKTAYSYLRLYHATLIFRIQFHQPRIYARDCIFIDLSQVELCFRVHYLSRTCRNDVSNVALFLPALDPARCAL